MESVKILICEVNFDYTEPKIYVKQIGTHRKKTISYVPTKETVKKLLSVFKVKKLIELKNKIFQAPKKNRTDWAFEFILDQRHL